MLEKQEQREKLGEEEERMRKREINIENGLLHELSCSDSKC